MEPLATYISSSDCLSIPLIPHSNSPSKCARPQQQTLFSPFESDDDPAQQTSMSASVPDESPPEPESSEITSANVIKSISHLRCQYERYRRAIGSPPRKRQRTRTLHTQPQTKHYAFTGLQGLSNASDNTSTHPTKPKESRPQLQKKPRLNGLTDRSNPRRKRTIPSSLWEQLAEAKRAIDIRPRVDPRFVPNSRPLECLQHLRTSIVVTLFPDGYVRHDWSARGPDLYQGGDQPNSTSTLPVTKQGAMSPKQQQSVTPRSTNIDQIPRYPYDRSSADFLRCLDLGLIPHAEDLPEPNQRFYYDGCLIAEIHDRRAPLLTGASLRKDGHHKVLLRPHMSSVYQDISLLTANVSSDIAQMVESEVLRLTSPRLFLGPHSQLTSYLSGTGVHTNIHPFNIIRIPRRKRICRPPGRPYIPSLSTAVMLLVSAADKQQTAQRYNLLAGNSTFSESSSTATQATNGVISNAPSPRAAARNAAELSSVKKSGPHGSPKLNGIQKDSTKAQSRPPRYLLPSKQLIDAASEVKSSGHAFSAVTAQGNLQRQQQRALPVPERLRIMRLILPDQQLAVEHQQAQAQAQAATKIGGAAAERAKLARSQVISRMNKPGMPVHIVEMVRKPNQSVEILFVKGIVGEKNRDLAHVVVSCEEDGKLVMDQFKAVAKKEGYKCFHDLYPEDIHAYQQQHVRNTYQQRQTPGEVSKPQGSSKSRQPVQQPGKPQPQPARNVQRGSRQGIPVSAANIQQLQHAQAKQKQLQAQRQQQQHPQQQQQLRQQLHQQSHPQLFRQQLQRQQQQEQMQNQQLVREQMQQLQRLDKTVHPSATALIHSGRAGPAVSNSISAPGGNVQIPAAPGESASLNTAGLSNLANGGPLTPSQMFPTAHLQQLQQMRVDQHRGMFATAMTGSPGSFSQAGNLTASGLTPQQLQSQALVAVMGSAGMGARPTAGGKGVVNPSIAGADGLNHPRLPPHMKHQRENVETTSRVAKR